LGTLAYLADVVASDKVEVACRFDVLVGKEHEFCLLTGESSPERALLTMVDRMVGNNLRLAVMTRGDRGAVAANAEERTQVPAIPVTVADTTGAGDAFTAGLAYAVAVRWDLSTALRLAASVASFVVEAVGAQIALPTLSAALARAGIATDDGSEFTR
jgi:ribokinase